MRKIWHARDLLTRALRCTCSAAKEAIAASLPTAAVPSATLVPTAAVPTAAVPITSIAGATLAFSAALAFSATICRTSLCAPTTFLRHPDCCQHWQGCTDCVYAQRLSDANLVPISCAMRGASDRCSAAACAGIPTNQHCTVDDFLNCCTQCCYFADSILENGVCCS